MRARISRVINRAKYAGIGGALGGAVGGIVSPKAASTGAGLGALVGAIVGEKWSSAAPVVKRARDRADDEEWSVRPIVERAKTRVPIRRS